MFQNFSKGGLEKAALRLAAISNLKGYHCDIISDRKSAMQYDVLISFKGHLKNMLIASSLSGDRKFFIREYNAVNELYLDRSWFYFKMQLLLKKILWF